MLSEQNEENYILEKNNNYNNSILNEDANTTYSESNKNGQSIMSMSMSMIMNPKEEVLKESGKKVKKGNKKKIITKEMKEQIEKMVDLQFEEEYNKLKNEYEEKIEDLLILQEKIINKNEIIKAKYDALESYLKNYCKMANIDYDSLLNGQ